MTLVKDDKEDFILEELQNRRERNQARLIITVRKSRDL